MVEEKDCERACELAGAARDLAGALRGMLEADGGGQKQHACVDLKIALIKWQMTCEGRVKTSTGSLYEFAHEHELHYG